MGMNLIGYLVKGPRRLDRKRRAAAIKSAQKLVAAAHAFVQTEGGEDSKLLHSLDDNDIETIAEYTKDDVTEAVDSLLAFWKHRYARDTLWVNDPDDPTQVLLFAGEGSWGEEPSGAGYTVLKEAERLDVLKFFGIR